MQQLGHFFPLFGHPEKVALNQEYSYTDWVREGVGGGRGSIFLKIYANKYTESYLLKLLPSLCTLTCNCYRNGMHPNRTS